MRALRRFFANAVERLRPYQGNLLAILFVLVIFSLPVMFALWMTAVPGQSYSGPLPALTADQEKLAQRLNGHVKEIARKPHNVQHPKELERVASYIENELTEMGYPIYRQPFTVDGQEVRNIEVTIEPAKANSGTLIVGAHYDSYSDTRGANDNASGTAAVIELARRLSDLRGKAEYKIRLVLFVNEEPPYFKTEKMGSFVYAKQLSQTDESVIGMFSLETMGYYNDQKYSQKYPFPLNLLYPDKGNFIAFVGMTSSRPLVRKTVKSFRSHTSFPSVGGSAPGSLQGIGWSDHWAFEQFDIPALMITDTAAFRYPHYHSRKDTVDKVDYEKLARVLEGLERVIRRWQ